MLLETLRLLRSPWISKNLPRCPCNSNNTKKPLSQSPSPLAIIRAPQPVYSRFIVRADIRIAFRARCGPSSTHVCRAARRPVACFRAHAACSQTVPAQAAHESVDSDVQTNRGWHRCRQSLRSGQQCCCCYCSCCCWHRRGSRCAHVSQAQRGFRGRLSTFLLARWLDAAVATCSETTAQCSSEHVAGRLCEPRAGL